MTLENCYQFFFDKTETGFKNKKRKYLKFRTSHIINRKPNTHVAFKVAVLFLTCLPIKTIQNEMSRATDDRLAKTRCFIKNSIETKNIMTNERRKQLLRNLLNLLFVLWIGINQITWKIQISFGITYLLSNLWRSLEHLCKHTSFLVTNKTKFTIPPNKHHFFLYLYTKSLAINGGVKKRKQGAIDNCVSWTQCETFTEDNNPMMEALITRNDHSGRRAMRYLIPLYFCGKVDRMDAGNVETWCNWDDDDNDDRR